MRPHSGARERRPDDCHRRHLREPGAGRFGSHAGAWPDPAVEVAVQAGVGERSEHGAADLHYASNHQRLMTQGTIDMRTVRQFLTLAVLIAATTSGGDVIRES